MNSNVKNSLLDNTTQEIRSLPFGRDRFAASYWLFMV